MNGIKNIKLTSAQDKAAGIDPVDPLIKKFKNIDINGKNLLPDEEAIKLEKEKNDFIADVKNFGFISFKRTKNYYKKVMPTMEVIEEEEDV